MTRLEPAGEPSMEEILASIRKIIAEDPPGSRAVPEPRAEPASPSVTDRIFQRMGEPTRSEPVKLEAAAEPYLRPSMPSLATAPSTDAAKPFDIDAQMAEVLSKTRGGATRRDVEPSFDPVAPQVQAALDSLPLAPTLTGLHAPQPRPGFTVARDGYVPDAAPSSAPAVAPVNDPFEFSLGPSPFAARSQPKPAIDTSMPEVRDTRYQDFGTFVPTRPMAGDAAPVVAKVNESAPLDAELDEQPAAPAVESLRSEPTVVASNSAPTPEVIAAQLKDFDAAINAPASAPEAALESVDKVLAELKSKLDQAAAPEQDAALVTEPQAAVSPVMTSAPTIAEKPDSEPVQEAPTVLANEAVPQPELEPVALSEAAPEEMATAVTANPTASVAAADIVSIADPAPIAAPEIVRELVREEPAQEMVIAEPQRETYSAQSSAQSMSPFHTMQTMQNAGMPGARTMEDTVAELLRPMLRNWLAENMPKIVERALRKEIDDSLHSEHKTAAE